MTVKKSYQIGDTAWIYGINRSNTKPAQGKVIKVVDLSDAGYSVGNHYIIEIPTHIEPLLEVRTWHNISQDEKGPVGSLRDLGNVESTIKFASTVGFAFDDNPELDSNVDQEDEISPDQIHAALEQTQRNSSHQPLILNDVKKPRRKFVKRKPKND
jgi:hypothetical protein